MVMLRMLIHTSNIHGTSIIDIRMIVNPWHSALQHEQWGCFTHMICLVIDRGVHNKTRLKLIPIDMFFISTLIAVALVIPRATDPRPTRGRRSEACGARRSRRRSRYAKAKNR